MGGLCSEDVVQQCLDSLPLGLAIEGSCPFGATQSQAFAEWLVAEKASENFGRLVVIVVGQFRGIDDLRGAALVWHDGDETCLEILGDGDAERLVPLGMEGVGPSQEEALLDLTIDLSHEVAPGTRGAFFRDGLGVGTGLQLAC